MIDPPRRGFSVPLSLRWAAWIGFTVLWTVLLIIPINEDLPFSDDPETRAQIRIIVAKTIHALAYTGWTILTASLRPSFGGRILLLFFLMAHAVGTEWAQLQVGRDGCLRDSAIDQAGILLGLLLSWSWWTKPSPSDDFSPRGRDETPFDAVRAAGRDAPR
jgi:VanZ family protein